MSKFERDLTEGSVAKQLVKFAMPFIISNLIQSLYSVADMIIVGNFTGVISMAGVNNGTQLTMLVTNAVIGLSIGATVLIGQYLGSGRKQEISDTIKTLFTLLIAISAILTVLTPFCDDFLLKSINVPDEAFSEAKSYFFICMMGTIFVFTYNALAAVMRGMGDSKHPLIFVAIAACANILLDLLFVGLFKLGASGAALATVISQALSVLLCIMFLRKNNFVF
ncbi:MAG: MATE family efflux transporter, partial [Clostridia bacterium]